MFRSSSIQAGDTCRQTISHCASPVFSVHLTNCTMQSALNIACLVGTRKNPQLGDLSVFLRFARGTGLEPATSAVTRRRSNQIELPPHSRMRSVILSKILKNVLVPADGVAPSSRVYESLVLTLELRRRSEEIRICVCEYSYSPNEPAYVLIRRQVKIL